MQYHYNHAYKLEIANFGTFTIMVPPVGLVYLHRQKMLKYNILIIN